MLGCLNPREVKVWKINQGPKVTTITLAFLEDHLPRLFGEQKSKITHPRSSQIAISREMLGVPNHLSHQEIHLEETNIRSCQFSTHLGLYYVFLCRVGGTTPTYSRPQEWGCYPPRCPRTRVGVGPGREVIESHPFPQKLLNTCVWEFPKMVGFPNNHGFSY